MSVNHDNEYVGSYYKSRAYMFRACPIRFIGAFSVSLGVTLSRFPFNRPYVLLGYVGSLSRPYTRGVVIHMRLDYPS